MTTEEQLVQANAEVERLKARVAGLETLVATAIDVMTDQQFGEVRSRMDALDAAR